MEINYHRDIASSRHLRYERGLSLIPCSSFDVSGGWQEESWRYRCDLQGPSRVTTARRGYAEVLHPRINVDSKRPWRGQAPWKAGGLTAGLAARIEGALVKGGLLTIPTDAGGGPLAQPYSRQQLEAQRLGAEPARELVELREQVTAEVMASCGCPMELFHGSEGAASREALRRWLHTTLLPWAEVVSQELSRKMEREISLSFDRLFASDLSGRARAFQSMVNGGMDVAKAARLAGLMEEE